MADNGRQWAGSADENTADALGMALTLPAEFLKTQNPRCEPVSIQPTFASRCPVSADKDPGAVGTLEMPDTAGTADMPRATSFMLMYLAASCCAAKR